MDMSKAYDRVDWQFLQSIMRKIGFCEEWIRMMMACVTTVSFSFLINGVQRGRLTPERGLRQGDALSPFLFLLVGELLSRLMVEAEKDGSIKGIHICRNAPPISHLLFADDAFLFCKADSRNMINMQYVLRMFCMVTGQEINFQKSAISFIRNVSEDDMGMLTNMLGVTRVTRQANYLGLPMEISHSKAVSFNFVVERMQRKMRGWKAGQLSSAGKLVMLKAVIQAVPFFIMQCFELPKSLCDDMHGVMSRFWWGDTQGGSRIHWMAWNRLCGSKEEGGLGLRNMHQISVALFAMQGWRILQRPSSLLSRVLKMKYFPMTSFLKASVGGGASYTWRSIAAGRKVLERGIHIQFGNGEAISVWEDRWLPIQYGFKLISRALDGLEGLKVCDLIEPGIGVWKVEYMKSFLLDFEVEAILKMSLSRSSLNDRYVWHHDRSGKYTVKGGYWAWRISESSLGASSSSGGGGDSWRKLWGLHAPEKIKVFVWRLMNNIIPTRMRLKERHCEVEDTSCPICGLGDETVEHAFRDCTVVRDVWRSSQLKHKICRAPKLGMMEWLRWILEHLSRHEAEVFIVSLWVIWTERNKVVWNQCSFNGSAMLAWGMHYLESYRKLHDRSENRKQVRDRVKWECPPSGRLKVNFDGAFRAETGSGGLGTIIRDEFGVGVAASAIHVDIASSALCTEALALREGLRMCISHGWQHIDIESDSIQLILAMMREEEDLSEVSPILMDCNVLICDLRFVNLRHVFREADSAADQFAHVACSNTRCGVWIEEMPEIVQDVLFEDSSSFSVVTQGLGFTSPLNNCIVPIMCNNTESRVELDI